MWRTTLLAYRALSSTSGQVRSGPLESKIASKLESAYADCFKQVVNTSRKHRKGDETHFEVTLVSANFENKTLLERNKMLNQLLQDEIRQIHSISFKLMTPAQWSNSGNELNKTPPCINANRTK